MQSPETDEIVGLVERFGSCFGWYDNKIDLKGQDLRSVATPECALTAHSPIWGTKEGAERAVPLTEVRTRIARLLRLTRATREDMHVSIHPSGEALGLFLRLKFRPAGLPVTMRTQTLAFVATATRTGDGLRISQVDEWSASDPEAASRILVEHHGWPVDTLLRPQQAFGAAS